MKTGKHEIPITATETATSKFSTLILTLNLICNITSILAPTQGSVTHNTLQIPYLATTFTVPDFIFTPSNCGAKFSWTSSTSGF